MAKLVAPAEPQPAKPSASTERDKHTRLHSIFNLRSSAVYPRTCDRAILSTSMISTGYDGDIRRKPGRSPSDGAPGRGRATGGRRRRGTRSRLRAPFHPAEGPVAWEPPSASTPGGRFGPTSAHHRSLAHHYSLRAVRSASPLCPRCPLYAGAATGPAARRDCRRASLPPHFSITE